MNQNEKPKRLLEIELYGVERIMLDENDIVPCTQQGSIALELDLDSLEMEPEDALPFLAVLSANELKAEIERRAKLKIDEDENLMGDNRAELDLSDLEGPDLFDTMGPMDDATETTMPGQIVQVDVVDDKGVSNIVMIPMTDDSQVLGLVQATCAKLNMSPARIASVGLRRTVSRTTEVENPTKAVPAGDQLVIKLKP